MVKNLGSFQSCPASANPAYGWDGDKVVTLLCGSGKASQAADRDHWVAYNPADYLNTAADIVEYLDAALEDGDDRVLVLAIGDATRAIGGMAELSRPTGLSEEALTSALSPDASPPLSTIRTFLKAFGLGLAGRPLEAA